MKDNTWKDNIPSIIVFMYINQGTGKNKIINKINGVNILLYGHVGQRYYERLSALYKITKIDNLKYHNLVDRAVQVIEENFNEYISKDGTPVKNKINCNVKVRCEGKIFDIEVALLIESSKVEWLYGTPKIVADEYIDYIAKGELRIDDMVIAIETLAVTIKMEHEDCINFTLMDKIGDIHVPKVIYNVARYELESIVKRIIKITTMRTEAVYDFIYNNVLA